MLIKNNIHSLCNFLYSIMDNVGFSPGIPHINTIIRQKQVQWINNIVAHS